MRRSLARILWSNPGNPPASVARALGIEPRRFGRGLHKIKAASDLSGADQMVIYSDGSVTDEQGEPLATSTTKTEAEADRRAFVTLRFAGDELDPDEISALSPVKPTRGHRKGGEFFAGPRAGNLHGRTGMWFLATDKLVPSDNLQDHLAFVQKLLCPTSGDTGRITKLRNILGRTRSLAHVTCFWRGGPGEATPEIPDHFKSAIQPLAADLETDFQPKS